MNDDGRRAPPPRTRSSGFGIAPRYVPAPAEEEPPRKRLSRSDGAPMQPKRRRELSPVMQVEEASETTVQDEDATLTNHSDNAAPSTSVKVPQSLIDAINAVKRFVPRSRQGRAVLDTLNDQISNLRVALQLEPKLTLYAPVEGINWNAEDDPADMAEPYDQAASILPMGVGMTCATYPANAPSEDRYTVVLGKDFCFAGVWDGHGGTLCSEYVAKHVFGNFTHAVLAGASIPEAFTQAYQKTDQGYLEYARLQTKDRSALFAGSCAIACHVDFQAKTVTCANLGDSRAVMAVVDEQGNLTSVVPLSTDHTTENPDEQARLQREHPDDKRLIVNCEPDEDEPPDWRVKGIAAFTRSLGDTQLKDKASAAVYNSYMPPPRRILPRPGIKPRPNAPSKTLPYLSNTPEIQTQPLSEGFIIIACDGVWDEMSSEEAVQIVYDLIVQDPNANLADLFIEQVLQRAVQRIRETDPEEANMTLDMLKARPQGKKLDSHRSNLHDDISVVILQFNGLGGATKTSTATFEFEQESGGPPEPPERRVWNSESNLSMFSRESLWSMGSRGECEASLRPAAAFMDITKDGIGLSGDLMEDSWNELTKEDLKELLHRLGKRVSTEKLDEIFGKLDIQCVGTVSMRDFETWWARKTRRQSTTKHRKRAAYNEGLGLQSVDENRQSTNDQIMGMIEVFGGMTARHLRILYDVLDADGSGELETDEINFLLRKVLGEDPTELLVETTFNEMDNDGSGAIGQY
eukprot:scaffold6679_cov144-Amphora_coffeaeformis.AAC.8